MKTDSHNKPPSSSTATNTNNQETSTPQIVTSETQSSTTDLRQRNITDSTSTTTTPPSAAAATTTNQGFVSMVPPTVRQATLQLADTVLPHQSRGWGSLFLIWVLLLTIGVLLARRLYSVMMHTYSSS